MDGINTESNLIEQMKALQDRNRRLKRLLAMVFVLLIGASIAIVITNLSPIPKTGEPSKGRLLRQDMTMLEVEELLGKPDRVDIKEGGVEGTLERPKVTSWVYRAYRVTDSGEDFGQPGHITFIPLRFTKRGCNDAESDKIARQYGEQADVFRAYAFRGSFPVDRNDWEPEGLLDAIPLKDIKK
jgi:hypothetical protein